MKLSGFELSLEPGFPIDCDALMPQSLGSWDHRFAARGPGTLSTLLNKSSEQAPLWTACSILYEQKDLFNYMFLFLIPITNKAVISLTDYIHVCISLGYIPRSRILRHRFSYVPLSLKFLASDCFITQFIFLLSFSVLSLWANTGNIFQV